MKRQHAIVKRVCTALTALAAAIILTAGAPASGQAEADPVEAIPYAWKNVTITGGGFVTGIVFHPAEPGLVYARTDVGGAYRWDGAGGRWIPLNDDLSEEDWTLTGIESLALDPADPDRVYLAAGSYTNDWSGNGAILRSEDRGATWKRTPMPFKFGANEPGRSNGERLAVNPARPEELYLGTRHDGLWRSVDHGASWSQVESFPIPVDTGGVGLIDIEFSPESDAVWVVVSSPDGALWRSDDNGTSWSQVEGQPKGLVPHQTGFSPDGNLYITYSSGAGPNDIIYGAVWKYNPSTEAWTNITPLVPARDDRFGYAGLGIDKLRPGTLLVSTICRWKYHDELFRSTDGGESWTRLGPTAEHDEGEVQFIKFGKPEVELGHWIGDVGIDPFDSDHALYITGMGIWGTDDLTAADEERPTHWTVRARGIEETVINELCSPASGAPLLSSMWDTGGFRHENLDTSPQAGSFQPHFGHTTGLDYAELDPQIVVRISGKNGAWSEDNGRSWTVFEAPGSSTGEGKVAVSSSGATWIWTPRESGSIVTRDRGRTWETCAGLPERVLVRSDRYLPDRFYALDPDSGTVYRSTDDGKQFEVVGETLPGKGDLRAVQGQPGHLWRICPSGLLRSTDGGGTWTAIAPGEVTGTRIAFGKPLRAFHYPTLYLGGEVAGQYGVFRSIDQGTTWVRINSDALQFHLLKAIAADQNVFGRVYVGTGGRGIFYGDPEAE